MQFQYNFFEMLLKHAEHFLNINMERSRGPLIIVRQGQ